MYNHEIIASTLLLLGVCCLNGTAQCKFKEAAKHNGLQVYPRRSDLHGQQSFSVSIRSETLRLTNLTASLIESMQNSTLNETQNTVRHCETDQKPTFVFTRGSLLTYLMRLKICEVVVNKTWLAEDCRDEPYAVTDYHKAIYSKFCDPNFFQSQCTSEIDHNPLTATYYWIYKHRATKTFNIFYKSSIATSATNRSTNSSPSIQISHCEAIESFFDSILPEGRSSSDGYSSNNLTLELEKPLYNVQYSEWLFIGRAFCRPAACGISKHDYDRHALNEFDCHASGCNASLMLTIAIDALLALLVVAANFVVLMVAWRSEVMRNIPGYFKVSLAVADMMVGLVVLPGSVYTSIVLFTSPLPFVLEGQMASTASFFTRGFIDLVGIFTVWSFSISIFTLGVASIDRYLAVTRPFRYKQGKYLTKRRSFVVFFFIWTCGFAISIYPIFTINSYRFYSMGLIMSGGLLAVAVYACALGLPLLGVWVINLALLGHVCSAKKKRRNVFAGNQKKISTTESYQGQYKPSVSTISLKRFSDQLNDDVFEADGLASTSEETTHLGRPTLYRRSQKESETQQHDGLSHHIPSAMNLKFRNRTSQASTISLTSSVNLERRLAKTLGVMIGMLTLALLPAVILTSLSIEPAILRYIDPKNYPRTFSAEALRIYASIEYIVIRLLFSNSFWNCIIYSIRNERFRQAIIDVFICNEEKRRKRRNKIAIQARKQKGSNNLTKTTSLP